MRAITPVSPERTARRFASNKELAAFIKDEYFGMVRPGEAFCIFMRTFVRAPEGPPYLSELACFGTLATAWPLCGYDEAQDELVLSVDRYLSYVEADELPVPCDSWRFPLTRFRGTPADAPFIHPRQQRPVRLLEVAVGLEEVAERCLSKVGHLDGLPCLFIGACEQLKWCPRVPAYARTREHVRQTLVTALFASRFSPERSGRLLEEAAYFGFANDEAQVRVGCGSMRMADFVADMKGAAHPR